eukprot:7107948-Pyramimonas_sp.AAC.1
MAASKRMGKSCGRRSKRKTGASGSVEACVALAAAGAVAAGRGGRGGEDRPAGRERRVEVHGPCV